MLPEILKAQDVLSKKVAVELLSPEDSIVRKLVWPMVEAGFAQYTDDGTGNGSDGQPIRLVNDRFDIAEKSMIVVASQGEKILGSFRIVNGKERPEIQPPIDSMILMNNNQWPEPGENFGEFSRFVVDYSLQGNEKQEVLRTLFERAMAFAEGQGFAENVFVILADHIHRLVEESGIETELCLEAGLNINNQEAKAVFDLWPRYWQPERYPEYNREGQPAHSPKLYRFKPQMLPYSF